MKKSNVKGIFFERLGEELCPILLEVSRDILIHSDQNYKFVESTDPLFERILKKIK